MFSTTFPFSKDYLATSTNQNAAEYVVEPGTLLQTRSGRNLGPNDISDGYLAAFAVSDDMLRVRFHDADYVYFVHAYLMTPTGQSILRRDKTGSVIDHIDEPHLRDQQIPQLPENVVHQTIKMMRSAIRNREKARLGLQKAQAEFEATLPKIKRIRPLKEGWTQRLGSLGNRLDAAFHDPLVKKAREALQAVGGRRLLEHAKVSKPGGRYRPVYVDAAHGRPLLSGSEVLQWSFVKPQYLAPHVLKNPAPYELKAHSIVFQADERAEEALARPAVVTKPRERWLASGHVGRVVPNEPKDWGWLFLAFNSSLVQAQLKALASGSVIDALYEHDIGNVILPPRGAAGSEGAAAWGAMGEAEDLRRKAISTVEASVASLIGEKGQVES